jgi:Ca2+-binding RTX toxin-like protein
LDGGTGTDRLSYSGSSLAVTVNLLANTATGGDATGDVIVLNSFENLAGSSYNDSLTGNALNNVLYGGAGNDTVNGGDGNDLLYLGDGNDYVNITSLGNDTFYAGNGNDYVNGWSGNEVYYGEAGNDTLLGSSGNDTIIGGAGADSLIGGAGADSLDGGTGTDMLSYSGSSLAVTVNLLANTATGGDATGDVIVLNSFENLTGSSYNDSLTGNALNNVLYGEAGNDTLLGSSGNDTIIGGAGADSLIGGAGADSLDGGTGTDMLSYSGSSLAVTVNLLANTATGGDATGDVIVLNSFENLTGSSYNDSLTGNALNNVLYGEAGNDTLLGSSGNDTIVGGIGVDNLTGGVGADRFVVAEKGVTNVDFIIDFSHTDDTIVLGDYLDGSYNSAITGLSFNSGVLSSGWYSEGAGFNGNSGELSGIFVNTTSGEIFYNPTSGTAGDSLVIAIVGTWVVASLDYTDFVLG